MARELKVETVYSAPGEGYWLRAAVDAAHFALYTYRQIAEIDAKRDTPVITRHAGALAVIDRTFVGPWNQRVKSVHLFGTEHEIKTNPSRALFVAKAIERAVTAEAGHSTPPVDATPAYLGLGRAHEVFSTGIAGPYPFHSRLMHDDFHHYLSTRLRGITAAPRSIGDINAEKVRDGHLGGDNGDAGDNTDELKRAREPYVAFAEDLLRTAE